jgi:hypothetical protein
MKFTIVLNQFESYVNTMLMSIPLAPKKQALS